MAARKSRCAQILQYLVGQGADINIKDDNGVNIRKYSSLSLPCSERERVMFINIDSVCEPSKFKVFYNSAAYFLIQHQHSKFEAYGSVLQFSCKPSIRTIENCILLQQ